MNCFEKNGCTGMIDKIVCRYISLNEFKNDVLKLEIWWKMAE